MDHSRSWKPTKDTRSKGETPRDQPAHGFTGVGVLSGLACSDTEARRRRRIPSRSEMRALGLSRVWREGLGGDKRTGLVAQLVRARA